MLVNATIIIIEDNPTPTSAYYSSNFLVIPTNNEQLDEEVRAARVIGSKLALPLPLLPQQQETATAQGLDQEVQVEEEEAKIPDDNNNNNNDRSSNPVEEENDEQKKVNSSLIAGIVGASGAGMVAMIAIGILVWQNTRQRPHQLSSNKDTIGSPNEKHERKKGPLLFSLPGEPMMAAAEVNASHGTTAAFNSHFNKWERQEQQQQQCHVSKFPSSTTYSTLFPTLATTHNVDNDNNNNNTNGTTSKHHEEEEWSSDTGSSESLSIRNLSTYDSTEENKAATDATTSIPKQQQQQSNGVESTLSLNYSHPSMIQPQVLNDALPSQQKQKQREVPMIDKDRKFQLSLVNKKLLHYPARSRHGFASTSMKSPYKEDQNDDLQGGMVSYDLDKLFYPSETKRNSSSSSSASVATIMSEDCPPEQHQLIRLIRQHYHVTPFDLPPSRFLPLQNCPFQLVTRQSILDDPEKRQGVHEIPE